ncbi:hypothetical protein [Aurantimonas endophytica]|uniref:Uncharacterized protein n=1 Tax=Aurantimonas endophytica TaxID=1522175 RepID=A0A7W6H9E4_9HYPH|nr:hypothetical protein [Aurantimonas endophytica]MBB4000957.1 hypothetical protein [Aurantimonas endophytica]MCO6403384.1 hypothetical protein [Aurantimonas endophytica]
MTTEHQNDPLLAEAIARRDESRAHILRSRANRAGGGAVERLASAFDKMAQQAEKASRQSADAIDDIEPPQLDKAGTAPTLSDSAGNFAPNPDVANVGGIGVEASNTKAGTDEQAQRAEDVDLSGATTGVGPDGEVGGGDVIDIPSDWEGSHWRTRVALAERLSGKSDLKAEEANEIIKAEVEQRG